MKKLENKSKKSIVAKQDVLTAYVPQVFGKISQPDTYRYQEGKADQYF
jgi:hypothetical protein